MALPPSPPRKKVEYKKPRRLNVVSGALALVLGALGYLLVTIWPLLVLRSNVKNELADALPHLWRINLQPEAVARRQLIDFRKTVTAKIKAAGVKDKNLQLVVDRSKKEVALQVRYAAAATFPGSTRKIEMKWSPRVVTDAARVDW